MRKALLRLEDVGPGGFYESEESLWKLQVIADFLSSAGVPFHVAMIPRSLGMHGYRHQYRESVSGDGFEFAYEDCTEDCPPDDVPTPLFYLDAAKPEQELKRMCKAIRSVLGKAKAGR